MRHVAKLVGYLCCISLAVVSCGRKQNTPVAAANPNHLVNFGKPEPSISIDTEARKGFVQAQLYAEDDNGFPQCEDPPTFDPNFSSRPIPAGCPSEPIGTQLPMQSYCHINENFPISWYQTNPPSSGDHWPIPSKSLGVNTSPVPREYYVHSMEHGAIILAYNCPEGCPYELDVMQKVVQARSDRAYKVLMTPDFRMEKNTFAAISWTWLYLFNTPDFDKLVCFVDEHYSRGREPLDL